MDFGNRLHDKFLRYLVDNMENLDSRITEENTLSCLEKPRLKNKDVETGDLLIIWEKEKNIVEILVVELTTSEKRRPFVDIDKLKLSRNHFFDPKNVKNLIKISGVDMLKYQKIVFRGLAVFYPRSNFFHEGPERVDALPKKEPHYVIYEDSTQGAL